MKTFYLIRHAKSSWHDPTLRDAERPLNKRGFRDAPFMANMLKSKASGIDLFISSPANRALTTCAYFAKEFGKEKQDIVQDHRIYGAYPSDILEIVRSQEDIHDKIALFGHNPTITSLANMFPNVSIDNVPTCGICVIESPADSWKQFIPGEAELAAFYYPKQFF